MDSQMLNFKRNALLGNISGQPLCADFKSAWRKCGDDKEELVRLVLQQQSQPFFATACNMGLGLTKDYVLENFGEFINGKRTFEDVEGVSGYTYQLYVGHNQDFDITADVTSLMWCDSPQVVVAQTKCPTIYISNGSNVHLVCDGFNTINVKLFDDSRVTIEDCDENSEIIVYKYGNRAEVEQGKFCLGRVKIFIKTLRL